MDLDNQVKARYENGETVREIAEDIGTTFGTVCNILNSRNVRIMSEARGGVDGRAGGGSLPEVQGRRHHHHAGPRVRRLGGDHPQADPEEPGHLAVGAGKTWASP